MLIKRIREGAAPPLGNEWPFSRETRGKAGRGDLWQKGDKRNLPGADNFQGTTPLSPLPLPSPSYGRCLWPLLDFSLYRVLLILEREEEESVNGNNFY